MPPAGARPFQLVAGIRQNGTSTQALIDWTEAVGDRRCVPSPEGGGAVRCVTVPQTAVRLPQGGGGGGGLYGPSSPGFARSCGCVVFRAEYGVLLSQAPHLAVTLVGAAAGSADRSVRWNGAAARVTVAQGTAAEANQNQTPPQLASQTLTLAWRFTAAELQCILVHGAASPSVLRCAVPAGGLAVDGAPVALRIAGEGVDLYRVYVTEAPTPEAAWIKDTTERDADGVPPGRSAWAGPRARCIVRWRRPSRSTGPWCSTGRPASTRWPTRRRP